MYVAQFLLLRRRETQKSWAEHYCNVTNIEWWKLYFKRPNHLSIFIGLFQSSGGAPCVYKRFLNY